MGLENYDKVWNKIRGSNINDNDAILMAGYGKNKYKICDYFLNNEYLNLYFVKRKSYKSIAKEKGLTEIEVQIKVVSEINILKVRLAENGLVDEISFNEDENYYSYIRNRIAKKGVLYVHLSDEITIKDIAKALNVGSTGINRVITQDKTFIRNFLKENDIGTTDRCVSLFVRIFGDYYKYCKNIPINYLKEFDEMIKKDSFLEGYVYKNFNYSDAYMAECLKLIDKVETKMKVVLKTANQRKNRRL